MLWSIIYGFIKISKFIKGKIKLNNKDFYYNRKVNINLENINIKTIIIQIIKGPYHIWYLYTTIGLYIIIPFTRTTTKNNDLLKTFIILNFINYLSYQIIFIFYLITH